MAQAKKIPTSANTKVSILSDIAMFTMDGEERLAAILLTINEKVKEGLVVPEKKSRSFLEAKNVILVAWVS